jgi:mono/diheme cytochrome c family protein
MQAVLLLFLLLSGLFVFNKALSTNLHTADGSAMLDINNSNTSTPSGVGKSLFQQNCAACHTLFKDMTGPALFGLQERGPWTDRKKLYGWIHNPPKFLVNDSYTQALREKFGMMMTAFPDLSEKDIDAIVDYINKSGVDPVMVQ